MRLPCSLRSPPGSPTARPDAPSGSPSGTTSRARPSPYSSPGSKGPAPAVDGGDRGDHRGDHDPGRGRRARPRQRRTPDVAPGARPGPMSCSRESALGRAHPVGNPGPRHHMAGGVDGDRFDRRSALHPRLQCRFVPRASGLTNLTFGVMTRHYGPDPATPGSGPTLRERSGGRPARSAEQHAEETTQGTGDCGGARARASVLLGELADLTIDSWLDQPTLRIYNAEQLAERVAAEGGDHRGGGERPLRRARSSTQPLLAVAAPGGSEQR